MKKKKKRNAGEGSALTVKVIKGAVIGLLVTVAAVLLLAVIAKGTDMSDETIAAFNQAIKIVSIFTAGLVASRGLTEKYMLIGALSGGLYVLLGYLTFSLIEGRLGDIGLLAADIAMGAAIGALTSFVFGKLLMNKKGAAKSAPKSGTRPQRQ